MLCGGVHGAVQILGDWLSPYRKWMIEKWKIKTNCFSWKLLQTGCTFSIVTFAWIFFRSDTIVDALNFLKRIFIRPTPWVWFNGGIYSLGLDRPEINILLASMLLLLLVDAIKYKKKVSIDIFLTEQNLWFEWLAIIGLILMIFIFGEYGSKFDAQQFIYFQF